MNKLRLYKLRREYNYSQKDIANILQIKPDTYRKWEQNINDFSLEQAATLANLYNVSLNYLLGLSKEKNINIKTNTINLDIITKRLKEIRKENNLNQNNFSNKVNLSQTTYSNYERGYRIITTKKLLKICKYYNVSIDYITGLSNKKNI